MRSNISNDAQSVQFVYEDYINGKFVVNRKYQRKLVWTLSEKQAFIDSLIREYSVPLFLLAKNNRNTNNDEWEILDGMQRLNAIFSFIENEFPVVYENENGYFDLESLAITKQMADEGILIQKQPVLSRNLCATIMKYPIPLSYIKADEASIETVFRRINSYGRQLSEQEIRQAGATCKFSDLVRIISSKIRGDVSLNDRIALRDMGKISLSSNKLDYGIDLNEVYWVKQQIILACNMRKSRDEEVVAYILTYILLGKKIDPSVKTLNQLYTYDELATDETDLSAKVNTAIEKIGFDEIIQNFIKIHDVLYSLMNVNKTNFHDMLFDKKVARGLVRSYQIVFLSLYQLVIIENLEVTDEIKLLKELKNVGSEQLSNVAGKTWDGGLRERKIKAVVANLRSSFKKKIGCDVAHESWVSQLENIFRLSNTEGAQYDFKQGLYDLGKSNKFLSTKLSEYICTLTAAVNKQPYTKGYLILGVAEKESTADRIKELYGEAPKHFVDTKFYITGVQGEINKYLKGDEDSYSRKVRSQIKEEPIDEYSKSYILTHMKFVKYFGKTIMVLELESKNNPVAYNNCFHVRENSETVKVEGASETMALLSRFA